MSFPTKEKVFFSRNEEGILLPNTEEAFFLQQRKGRPLAQRIERKGAPSRLMPELLRHLGKEVCGECETRIWYAGGKRRPPDPPISMLIGKNVSWVVQSIRALAGTHVEANIEIGGAGVWLPRNPTGAPAHKPLFSSGAIIRASTILQPVLRPLAIRSSDPLPCFPKRSVKGLGRQPFLSLARQSGCGGNMEKPTTPGAG